MLATGRILLLLLRQLRLHLLLQCCPLLTGGLQQRFTLLTGLLPQLIHLAFGFLTNRGAADQLFMLAPSLLHDFLSLLLRRVEHAITMLQQLCRSLDFSRERLSNGVEQLN